MVRFDFCWIFIFLFSFSIVADSIPQLPMSLQRRIEKVLNKAGISFDGEFKSGHFGSSISGQGLDSNHRTIESNDFSTVDFDIHARPNTSASGRLILRMHHNWQNYWSDPGNPITARWISIDGVIANKIPFSVGNFKALYTPLTIYVPEPELLFEPEIFQRQRKGAMEEVFVENNERPLEGLTMGLDVKLAPLFDQFHANVLGVRLRNTQTSINRGLYVVNGTEASPDFSKLAFGSTVDAIVLNKISIGGSLLSIADNKMNYRNSGIDDATVDLSAQSTTIADARIGLDLKSLVSRWDFFRLSALRLYTEAAFSFDDSAWYENKELCQKAIPGRAAVGGIFMQTNMARVCLLDFDVKYISNESNFRNVLAQSPCFLGKRIMNIESDTRLATTQSSIAFNHYSTFDALYHNVFKFCPKEGTNQWDKAPFTKNSYSNIVYSKNELRGISDSGLDPSVQLIMPFGPATPNRRGIDAQINVASPDSGIQVSTLLSFLGERSGELDSTIRPPVAFSQEGIGACIDIAKVVQGLHYPLAMSFSFVHSTASDSGALAEANDTWSGMTIRNDFYNLGLSWQFWKKTSLLGGMQFIKTYFRRNTESQTQRQTHWLLGLSWQAAEAADVIGSFGQIIVDNNSDEAVRTGSLLRNSKGDFKQFLTDISLRVYF
jgi:hypothetical protein